MLKEFSQRLLDAAGTHPPALSEAKMIITSMTKHARAARTEIAARKVCSAWNSEMPGWIKTIRAWARSSTFD